MNSSIEIHEGGHPDERRPEEENTAPINDARNPGGAIHDGNQHEEVAHEVGRNPRGDPMDNNTGWLPPRHDLDEPSTPSSAFDRSGNISDRSANDVSQDQSQASRDDQHEPAHHDEGGNGGADLSRETNRSEGPREHDFPLDDGRERAGEERVNAAVEVVGQRNWEVAVEVPVRPNLDGLLVECCHRNRKCINTVACIFFFVCVGVVATVVGTQHKRMFLAMRQVESNSSSTTNAPVKSNLPDPKGSPSRMLAELQEVQKQVSLEEARRFLYNAIETHVPKELRVPGFKESDIDFDGIRAAMTEHMGKDDKSFWKSNHPVIQTGINPHDQAVVAEQAAMIRITGAIVDAYSPKSDRVKLQETAPVKSALQELRDVFQQKGPDAMYDRVSELKNETGPFTRSQQVKLIDKVLTLMSAPAGA